VDRHDAARLAMTQGRWPGVIAGEWFQLTGNGSKMFSPASIYVLVLGLFFGLLAVAVLTDVETLRIPNRLCLALVAIYPAHVLASPIAVDWPGGLLLAGAVFGGGLVSFAAGWVGGGDVKLMAATALWVGPASFVDFLLVTAIAGGAIAVLMLSGIRFTMAQLADSAGFADIRDVILGRSIPYGVAIAVGGWVAAWRMLNAAGG
jgi:prepilin peptidase CpaA